ncbi:MAG: 23S rRNA (adenine(2030)-N(6))-methyltransferase RlmJ [Rhizobiales bacterium]|nr:23S rRNA (adenine(2030)-N(6))-methyltransferase RlmJ [Hyphomicrobiales bacterium]
MNYRHAYHAGNHADVLKHVVLTRILVYLTRKNKPFRVIDAHAGIGVYDLDGSEAQKTGEWQGGIARLAEAFSPAVESLLKPYRDCLAALNPAGGYQRYPGSPWLAAQLMREGDRLVANELHPDDRALLEACFAADPRVTVTGVDAEICIRSQLPPPERRGLVLIDPPYEQKAEAERALAMLAQGLKRFANGCHVLWYPVKADGVSDRMRDGAVALGAAGALAVELRVKESFEAGGLAGSGLVIVNPPWTLAGELDVLMPALARRLGLGSWGQGG